MRLPYVNLRVGLISLVVLLLIGAGVVGALWYQNRPDTLYASAQSYFRQAEEERKSGNADKARADYEKANTQLEKLLAKEPKRGPAWLLRYKVLSPLARLTEKVDKPKAVQYQEDAYLSGTYAADIDRNNVEAQAIMLSNFFRKDDFTHAYPYARGLVDSLPGVDRKTVDLDGFSDYVIGAYYVLALKELEGDQPNPDKALKYLAASLEEEKAKPDVPGVARPSVPRWRDVELEIKALSRKAEAVRKQPSGGGKAAEVAQANQALKSQTDKYLERARAELKETIPAAEGKPEQPLLATLSKTNAAGLMDFLILSLQFAEDHAVVEERAELMLQVCEKLAGSTGAAPHIYQDAARGATYILLTNGKLPTANRLKSEELAKMNERIIKVNKLVEDKGPAIDPITYLEMSRTAQADDRPRALALALTGLKLADAQHLPAGDHRVLDLHKQAAWLLLLDKKVKEADEHLNAIRKEKQMLADVSHMQGLAAVLDGRLDDGAAKLEEARKNSRYQDNLPLLLGLATSYMGQGQLDRALPVLEKLQSLYEQNKKLGRDDQQWVELWLPNLTAVALNIFRCHLTLAIQAKTNQEAANHFKRAMEYRKALRDETNLAGETDAALITYYLTFARTLRAKDPDAADKAIEAAKEVVAGAKASERDDARMLWAEVNTILSTPQTNDAAAAAALTAPLGAPGDLAVQLGELGRLRSASAWQWQKAEGRVKEFAARKDRLATQLAWVRWLQVSGRGEEAVAELARLEKLPGRTEAQKSQIQATRAMFYLGRGQPKLAEGLIADVSKGDQLSGEVLHILALLGSGKAAEAKEEIEKAVSKHDQSGLLLYWQGQVRQSNGDFAQAIQSYERSLQYTRFKGVSESGILGSVMGMAYGPPGEPGKGNPKAAFDEAKRLSRLYPDDLVVTLAYAVMARLLDKVYDKTGMEGALDHLKELYQRDHKDDIAGHYVAAQQWVAAGRPDRARLELREVTSRPEVREDSAGEIKKTYHLPSLALAIRLAIADEDWDEVDALLKGYAEQVPDAFDLPLWRAALAEARGQDDDAAKFYTDFKEKHKKNSAGYGGLVHLAEKAEKYKDALKLIDEWGQAIPGELNCAQAEVRVRSRMGKVEEAVAFADKFIADQLKRLGEQRDEAEKKNPIKGPKSKEGQEERALRDKAWEASQLATKLLLTHQLSAGFQQAKAYAEAEKWMTDRALPLMDQIAKLEPVEEKAKEGETEAEAKKRKEFRDARRKEADKQSRMVVELILGSLYLEHARSLEKSAERARLMDQAVAEYRKVWEAEPGHFVAGNNLAWLLTKEKGEAEGAYRIIQEARLGQYSREPISGERLPLEFLDTLGVVYRASGHQQESLALFDTPLMRQRYDNESLHVFEPRVFMHLAQSQAAMRNADAAKNFNKVIDMATYRLAKTTDPDRKKKLQGLIDDARTEREKIGLVPKK